MPLLFDSAPEVPKNDIVDKSVEVLKAGGTVYIGEHHNQREAREICLDIFLQNCVQFFCIEFDDIQCNQDEMSQTYNFIENSPLGRKSPVKIGSLIDECRRFGGFIVPMDNYQLRSDLRQMHMATKIKMYRAQISRPLKGLLVLVGGDHLEDVNDESDTWTALQTLVYDGYSFVHGKHRTSHMVWHLS